MDDDEEGLRFLHAYWEQLSVVDGQKIKPLRDFLGQCLGERSGGILFIGCGKEEGNSFILKLDLGYHLYRRVADTGEDDKDWKWIGDIVA